MCGTWQWALQSPQLVLQKLIIMCLTVFPIQLMLIYVLWRMNNSAVPWLLQLLHKDVLFACLEYKANAMTDENLSWLVQVQAYLQNRRLQTPKSTPTTLLCHKEIGNMKTIWQSIYHHIVLQQDVHLFWHSLLPVMMKTIITIVAMILTSFLFYRTYGAPTLYWYL